MKSNAIYLTIIIIKEVFMNKSLWFFDNYVTKTKTIIFY